MRALAFLATLCAACLAVAVPANAHAPPDLVTLDATFASMSYSNVDTTGAADSTATFAGRVGAAGSALDGISNSIGTIAVTSRFVEPG